MFFNFRYFDSAWSQEIIKGGRMNSKTLFGTLLATAVTSLILGAPLQAASVEELSKTCAECHQKDGNSTDPHTPIIAGMSVDYFLERISK